MHKLSSELLVCLHEFFVCQNRFYGSARVLWLRLRHANFLNNRFPSWKVTPLMPQKVRKGLFTHFPIWKMNCEKVDVISNRLAILELNKSRFNCFFLVCI